MHIAQSIHDYAFKEVLIFLSVNIVSKVTCSMCYFTYFFFFKLMTFEAAKTKYF